MVNRMAASQLDQPTVSSRSLMAILYHTNVLHVLDGYSISYSCPLQPNVTQRQALPFHGAGTTWVEVSISLRAGLWCRKLGSQSRSDGPCLRRIQGPAWLFGGSGWFAARATHPHVTGSGLLQSSGRTRRAPTYQKALHLRQPDLGAADGAKPDRGYLPGCREAPRDQSAEGGGRGGGGADGEDPTRGSTARTCPFDNPSLRCTSTLSYVLVVPPAAPDPEIFPV